MGARQALEHVDQPQKSPALAAPPAQAVAAAGAFEKEVPERARVVLEQLHQRHGLCGARVDKVRRARQGAEVHHEGGIEVQRVHEDPRTGVGQQRPARGIERRAPKGLAKRRALEGKRDPVQPAPGPEMLGRVERRLEQQLVAVALGQLAQHLARQRVVDLGEGPPAGGPAAHQPVHPPLELGARRQPGGAQEAFQPHRLTVVPDAEGIVEQEVRGGAEALPRKLGRRCAGGIHESCSLRQRPSRDKLERRRPAPAR